MLSKDEVKNLVKTLTERFEGLDGEFNGHFFFGYLPGQTCKLQIRYIAADSGENWMASGEHKALEEIHIRAMEKIQGTAAEILHRPLTGQDFTFEGIDGIGTHEFIKQ